MALITHYSDITEIMVNKRQRVRTSNRRGSLICDTTVSIIPAAMAATNILLLDVLPKTACLKSLKLTLSATDAALTGTVGLYGIEKDGSLTNLAGTVNSSAIFGTPTFAAALTDSELLDRTQKTQLIYEILYANCATDAQKLILKSYWSGEKGKDALNFALAFTCTHTPTAGPKNLYADLMYVEGAGSYISVGSKSPDDKVNPDIIGM